MFTKDIKKGTRIKMANGWFGTMKDNARGTTRIVEVEGYYTETGSVYSHDIQSVQVGDSWVVVEHTEKELQLKQQVEALLG